MNMMHVRPKSTDLHVHIYAMALHLSPLLYTYSFGDMPDRWKYYPHSFGDFYLFNVQCLRLATWTAGVINAIFTHEETK